MRNKILHLFMVLLLASCGSGKTTSLSSDAPISSSSSKVSVQSILSAMDQGSYKDGELLVKFKPDVTPATSSSINQSIGASLIRNFALVQNLQQVKLPANLSVKDAVTRYMSDPNVVYAEPNYLFSPSIIPNDTSFSPQQWALQNSGFAGGTASDDIKAPKAWDITTGDRSVVIAVLDTGIDYTHPDLAGNIWTNPGETGSDASGHDKRTNLVDDDGDGKVDDWRGWNFVFVDKNGNGVCDQFPEDPVKNENCNDPFDDWGHGTHVAGIIGAVGNNNLGIAGLMWKVQLMALKVCDVSLGGCPLGAIEEGIEYAVSKNVKVINASLGGNVFSQSLEDEIAAANAAHILFVAAAGNNGTNNDIAPYYPASYSLPNIISVAATDQNDRLAAFSNFGPASVHVAAPGTYILSTVPSAGVASSFISVCTSSEFADYDYCSGTSMAAPFVSGLAGLLYSAYPGFMTDPYGYTKVRGMILKYVDKAEDGYPGLETVKDKIFTSGRINAFKALSSLLAPTNLVATPLSSDKISLSWTINSTGEDGFFIERKVSGGDFVRIVTLYRGTASFTDSGLSPSTTYYYRLTAFSQLPDPPGSGAPVAESNPVEVSQTTLSGDSPAPETSSGGGGGGCSIGARQNSPTAFADTLILLTPLLFIAVLRRKNKR